MLQAFFENINPLSGFENKEALETYLYKQSQQVEPKDAGQMVEVVSVLLPSLPVTEHPLSGLYPRGETRQTG